MFINKNLIISDLYNQLYLVGINIILCVVAFILDSLPLVSFKAFLWYSYLILFGLTSQIFCSAVGLFVN